MKVEKVERFLSPSGALFEKEDEAINEMLNFASQLVSQAEPSRGNPYISGASRGAARGDRTLDLSLTNVTPHSKSPGISAKTAPAGTERGENRRRTK